MKIAQKLGLLVGALLAAVLITILVLSVQLRSTAKQYENLIDGNIQQREAARTMLVDFGVQVTDLQQILLQARTDAAFDTLKKTYTDQAAKVDKDNTELLANVGQDDPRLKTMLTQFQSTHKAIGIQYGAALVDFQKSKYQKVDVVSASIQGLDKFPNNLVNVIADYRTRSAAELIQQQKDSASSRLRLTFLLGALLFLAAGAVSFVIVRNIVRPVRSLTAAALAVANDRMPQVVSEISTLPAEAPAPTLPPFRVTTHDELAELAGALNTLQDSAVNLALEQRRNEVANAETLVNLGRRNQSLMTRMLGYVTELERDESNPSALDRLFRLDHLTTRIRRNAESLLVLAGAKQTRTWSHPIAMQDVVRAALSEIEEYNRVTVHHMDHAKVSGSVAADLTHMLAELLENATRFSPRERQVQVVGRLIPGGYQFDVIDAGLGMSDDDLTEANDRISQAAQRRPDAKVLGLHVVGRIADRREMVVRLLPSDQVGLTAQVLVPASVISDAKLPATFHDVTEVPMLTAAPSPSAVANPTPASMAPTPRRTPNAAPARQSLMPQSQMPDLAGVQNFPSSQNLPARPQPSPMGQLGQGAVAPFPAVAPAGAGMPPVSPGGASRRVRGAQLGDLGPNSADQAPRTVDPNLMRSQMSGLQNGAAAARRNAGPAQQPQPRAVPQLPAAASSLPQRPQAPQPGHNPGGPARRVRGAQLGDLGAGPADQSSQPVDPNRVRSQMSSLQNGVTAARQQGAPDAGPQPQAQNPSTTPVRRVRGAQLHEVETDTGGAFRGLPRDAQGIGRQLSNLQAATMRATQETGRLHATDDETMGTYE
jgi:signal transduction histidine kinase